MTSSGPVYLFQNRPEPGSGVIFCFFLPSSLTRLTWLWIAASTKTQPFLFWSLPTQFSFVSASPHSLTHSLPQCRLGWEEQAETPHRPRWLAANQLQPKVIGSRWETFWWRKQGEQVASWKEEEKNKCKAQGEWKERRQSVSCSGQLGEPFLSVNTLNWLRRNELKRALMSLSFNLKQQSEGRAKGVLA